MTKRLNGAIAIGIFLGLGATACSSSQHGATTSSSSTSTSTPPASDTTSTSAPSSSSTTGPAPATSVTTPSGPGPCTTSDLSGRLTGADGTAGSIYYQLQLTNRSAAACVIEGYPGVSFVYGSQGQQVGAAAGRTTGAVVPVMLSPGSTASATLQITVAANYGQCGVTATDGLRVYPPNQHTSLLIDHNDQACSDTKDVTLHVGPFRS